MYLFQEAMDLQRRQGEWSPRCWRCEHFDFTSNWLWLAMSLNTSKRWVSNGYVVPGYSLVTLFFHNESMMSLYSGLSRFIVFGQKGRIWSGLMSIWLHSHGKASVCVHREEFCGHGTRSLLLLRFSCLSYPMILLNLIPTHHYHDQTGRSQPWCYGSLPPLTYHIDIASFTHDPHGHCPILSNSVLYISSVALTVVYSASS